MHNFSMMVGGEYLCAISSQVVDPHFGVIGAWALNINHINWSTDIGGEVQIQAQGTLTCRAELTKGSLPSTKREFSMCACNWVGVCHQSNWSRFLKKGETMSSWLIAALIHKQSLWIHVSKTYIICTCKSGNYIGNVTLWWLPKLTKKVMRDFY